jgi:tripartite-type tricarboxylate transporter receptor subunit TctC
MGRLLVKNRLKLVLQLGLFVGLICFPFYTGMAAEYPDRPVSLSVSYAAGGTTDLIARVLAAGTEKSLGKSLVIENKAGGQGTVALSILANAKPDGYTLCATMSDAIVYTPLMQKVTLRPLKSFVSIIGFAEVMNTGLIVKSDAPWKTFGEFIDYAKKNPGKVKYSSAGVGSGMHLAMEEIARKDGIKWIHVPYTGTAPAIVAVLGGHVDACSAGAEFVPYARADTVRVLATHGQKRSPTFPDVPTLKELGYGFSKETVFAIVAPAGVPEAVIKKLEAAFTKGTQTPELKAMLEKLDLSQALYKGNDYDQYLRDLWTRSEKMLKEIGIIKEAATQPY